LQALQHAFNELIQQLRNKEGEKNLVSQRVIFLQEKESNLQDFLSKAQDR